MFLKWFGVYSKSCTYDRNISLVRTCFFRSFGFFKIVIFSLWLAKTIEYNINRIIILQSTEVDDIMSNCHSRFKTIHTKKRKVGKRTILFQKFYSKLEDFVLVLFYLKNSPKNKVSYTSIFWSDFCRSQVKGFHATFVGLRHHAFILRLKSIFILYKFIV
jgi:hypothetical protein